MASRTFSIGSGIVITLTDVVGGVQIDIATVSSSAGKDITAVFFDLADDSNLSSYIIAPAVLPLTPATPPPPSEVTASQFLKDGVSSIGGVNLNPAGNFDVGVAIADTGSGFIGATSFVVLGTGLNLEDFNNQRFGVRLSGTQSGSKIIGNIGDTIAPNAPTIGLVAGDNIVNSIEKTAGVTVSGTAEANSTINITWGSITLTTTTTASGTWSRNFTSAQIPGDGSTTIRVTATDAGGNTSAPATRAVSIDTVAPTVTVTDNVPGTANLTTSSIDYTYTFNESVTGLAANDFAVTNGTVGTITGSGTTWTVNVIPTANVASGNISLVLANAAVIDAAGNPNVTVTSNAQAIDTVAPTVVITLTDSALTSGETATVNFTFSEIPTGFDITDISAENGTITALNQSLSDPKSYTATFNPTVNVNDTTNVIRVGTGYTDAAGNPGTAGTSPNYTVNTLAYSPLTSTLGYVSYRPGTQQGDPNSIVIQPIENIAANNGVDQAFVLLEEGKSFIQTITLTNDTTNNTASDPNAAFTYTTTNSPFVQFNYLWYDANNNNVLDGNEVAYTGQALGLYRSSYGLNPSLNPGESFLLKARSTIVNQDNSLTKQNLSFQLQDNPNDPNDLGNATANTTLYLTQDGFSKQSGSTEFSFAAFAPSTLTVTGNSGIAVNPLNNPNDPNDDRVYSQSATLPRDAGTLIEGSGGQTQGLQHFFWLDDFKADADNTLLSSKGGTNSDPITLTNFLLVWNVPPGLDYTAFANTNSSNGFNTSPGTTNNDGIPNSSVIELFSNGYFSQAYADTTIQKNGQTLTGSYQGTRGNQSITQTAVSGSIGPSSLNEALFRNGFTGTFNQFINQLDSSKTWKIKITDTTNISGTASNPLILSNYSWALNPDVAVVQMPPEFSSSLVYVSMGNGGGNVDLSKTGFFLSNGTPIGVNLSGGNGQDRMRGTSSDDTLTGGNAKDTFVFGVNSGTDTITDFKTSGGSAQLDLLDLTELGINQNNVLNLLDSTSNGGNGNGIINAGDRGVTLVSSGSTSSLKLDLSYFSDLKAGLNPSLNGSLNTNTTIILKGVSSLTSSFFV
ncbi:MAG: Ig-like domain-containing protein [Leptolyngbya sp. BL-A-14]